MKKLTPILILSLLFLSCGDSQKEYDSNDLVEMDNGLWTEKFSDEPITGKVFNYYGEKKPSKKVYMGNLRDGKKEGKWVSYYHSTGKKRYEQNYKNGKPDGLVTEWYENGQMEYEGTWKDGKYDGLQNFWYEDGKKKLELNYSNNKLISLKEWNEDGSVKE